MAAKYLKCQRQPLPSRPMELEVGMTAWRKAQSGWEQGHISGQVFDFDCWYVTTKPGQTYVNHGHQLTTTAPHRSLTSLIPNRHAQSPND